MIWNEESTNLIIRKQETGLTIREIAEDLTRQYGEIITENSVKSRLKRFRKSLKEPVIEESDEKEFEIDNESILDKISLNNDQTPDEIVSAHGFDPEKFELVSVDNGVWQQGSKNGVKDLLKSRIKVKPREIITENSMLNLIKEFTTPVIIKKSYMRVENERNLVIPLADLHFGIITYDDLSDRLTEIVDIIRQNFYGHIVIENLGDLFHSDKINSTETVSGTILDEVDMVKAIQDGMKFMSVLIQEALEHAEKVSVKSIGGNHSFDNEYLFMNWVQERFPQANIEVTNRYRTAYMLGNVLIMAQHGDVAKKNVELLLATEYPKLWGEKTSAEIHRGHYHSEKITDTHGVVVRQFGTPKKEDPYEIKNGFTGNKKELIVLEYSMDKLKNEYHI